MPCAFLAVRLSHRSLNHLVSFGLNVWLFWGQYVKLALRIRDRAVRRGWMVIVRVEALLFLMGGSVSSDCSLRLRLWPVIASVIFVEVRRLLELVF